MNEVAAAKDCRVRQHKTWGYVKVGCAVWSVQISRVQRFLEARRTASSKNSNCRLSECQIGVVEVQIEEQRSCSWKRMDDSFYV